MENEHRRISDAQLELLGQKFDSFIAAYSKDQATAQEWRKTFEGEMAIMKLAIGKMMIPYRLAGWIVTITGSAFLIELGKRTFEYLRAHVH